MRWIVIVLACAAALYAQLDRMEGPGMEVSTATLENDAKLNEKYRKKYQDVKGEFSALAQSYHKKAMVVKWLLLVGWLLPALAVGSNAIRYKLLKWGGPVAILVGTTLTGGARYMFEADEKSYKLAALDVEAIQNDWTITFSDVEDDPHYFSDPGRLSRFKEELSRKKTELNQIKRRLASRQSAAPVFEEARPEREWHLIPAAYAEPLRSIPLNRRSTVLQDLEKAKRPVIDIREETLHVGTKKFPLKGLSSKLARQQNALLVAGVGMGDSYQKAKDRALASLHENHTYKVLHDIPLLSAMKDTLLAYLAAEQATEYYLKEPLYEQLLLDSQYIFLVVAATPLELLKNGIEEMNEDSGFKLHLDRILSKEIAAQREIAVPQGLYDAERDRRSKIAIKNSARPTQARDGAQYFRFKVFLNGQEDALAEVDSVVYHMHRTFRHKNVKAEKPEDGFAYAWDGWGVFTLSADVYFKDSTQKILYHKLNF